MWDSTVDTFTVLLLTCHYIFLLYVLYSRLKMDWLIHPKHVVYASDWEYKLRLTEILLFFLKIDLGYNFLPYHLVYVYYDTTPESQ